MTCLNEAQSARALLWHVSVWKKGALSWLPSIIGYLYIPQCKSWFSGIHVLPFGPVNGVIQLFLIIMVPFSMMAFLIRCCIKCQPVTWDNFKHVFWTKIFPRVPVVQYHSSGLGSAVPSRLSAISKRVLAVRRLTGSDIELPEGPKPEMDSLFEPIKKVRNKTRRKMSEDEELNRRKKVRKYSAAEKEDRKKSKARRHSLHPGGRNTRSPRKLPSLPSSDLP